MQEVMEPILQIQVLGKFTLRYGETVISDEDDRSRKVWAVLAYLIYHREKIISQQELVDLCWGEDTRSSDPHNALKSVIHRIRATLDKLQEGLGRTLLRRKAGCYIWNTDVPLEVDAEVFDTLCSRGAALEGDERLEAYQQALALYSNDILPKLSSELWLVPITTYYHQRYVQTAEESIQLWRSRTACRKPFSWPGRPYASNPIRRGYTPSSSARCSRWGTKKGPSPCMRR
jgi:DNA-binding SARP family transcriptional activator